jgi:hypothetical protein
VIGRIRALRPSYAGVTATLALVLALGTGGAYATGKIGSKQIAKSAVKSKHIKDGGVKTPDLAAGVKVPFAKSADQANTAKSADEANTAKSADEATSATNAGTAEIGLSPVAYAMVDRDGGVLEARSRGVSDGNVKREYTSAFCFRDLPFKFKTVQTTPIYEGNEEDVVASVNFAGAPGLDCSNADLEVATTANGAWTPRGFYVWFYN